MNDNLLDRVVLVTVFTCLSGFTQSFWQLLTTRTLQGLGFGGEWSVAIGSFTLPMIYTMLPVTDHAMFVARLSVGRPVRPSHNGRGRTRSRLRKRTCRQYRVFHCFHKSFRSMLV
jgi:hypothetical protein